MNKKQLLSAAFATLLIGGALVAQGTGKQAMLMALGANGKQMVTWQWKQKITVFRSGSPSEPIIEEVRFDATGQPRHIVLARPEPRHVGPLRARKASEIKDDVQDVMQLTGRYANPQQVAEAIKKGELWEGQGRFRVQSRFVILPSDEMTIMAGTASCLPTRIDVKTQYEGAPVTIGIDYEQLPGGPSMVSRMTVQIPKDNITVHVESFDFQRLAASMIP